MGLDSPTSPDAGIATDDLFQSLLREGPGRGEALRTQLAGRYPECSADEIEEAIQYACKSFLDEAEDISAPGQVYAWIRTAAHRSLGREADRHHREVAVDPVEDGLDGVGAEVSGPVEELIELDPTLLHISMVFVHPTAQGTGVGSSLVLHVLDAARSLGYQRASVWTYRENANARRLYEGVGMEPTGKSARGLTRTQIQYGCVLGGQSQVPQAAEGCPRGDLQEASGE